MIDWRLLIRVKDHRYYSLKISTISAKSTTFQLNPSLNLLKGIMVIAPIANDFHLMKVEINEVVAVSALSSYTFLKLLEVKRSKRAIASTMKNLKVLTFVSFSGFHLFLCPLVTFFFTQYDSENSLVTLRH